ncbi:DNA-binding transcriptional activator DevR/DosR [BD1-7 clade bacterium]|uniref:DNA-binding transcriptional activator DevR/DosR n=1 Tax=BD1-7 clade bacterium TaxID=2029982 RepID=A0A5S9QYJ5_9GAMM|nr:DNA-binding transcriptional activator DevR/DosR [BD1-7 clade bacterium]
MPTKSHQIVIADGHPLFRVSLMNAITEYYPDATIELPESFGTLNRAMGAGLKPDLLILDLTLPESAGFSGLIMLLANFRRVPVLVISANTTPRVISKAIEHGASGFLSVDSDSEEISSAIGCILKDGVWIPTDVGLSQGHLNDTEAKAALLIGRLTPQQFRIAAEMAEGLTNRHIMKKLDLTKVQLKKQLDAILRKLEVRTRKQAVLSVNYLHRVLNATTTTLQ